MPWVAVWVAAVMESLVAASFFLARNPRSAMLIQEWLKRWTPWVARQSFNLYQQASRLALETGRTMTTTRPDFVRIVLRIVWKDMEQLGRYYKLAPRELDALAVELETLVAREIAGWTTIPAAFRVGQPLTPPFW